LWHWKIDPLAVLKMEESDWNWKAADAEACADVVLAIKGAPNTSYYAANHHGGKCKPQTFAGVLASELPKQCDKYPEA
jgi:hypothetical protein